MGWEKIETLLFGCMITLSEVPLTPPKNSSSEQLRAWFENTNPIVEESISRLSQGQNLDCLRTKPVNKDAVRAAYVRFEWGHQIVSKALETIASEELLLSSYDVPSAEHPDLRLNWLLIDLWKRKGEDDCVRRFRCD